MIVIRIIPVVIETVIIWIIEERIVIIAINRANIAIIIVPERIIIPEVNSNAKTRLIPPEISSIIRPVVRVSSVIIVDYGTISIVAIIIGVIICILIGLIIFIRIHAVLVSVLNSVIVPSILSALPSGGSVLTACKLSVASVKT